MARPFIVPFFLSNQGCPHRCLYCDQKRSGAVRGDPLSPQAVQKGLAAGLASKKLAPGRPVVAAFFGGTFSSLPIGRQEELLNAVAPFLGDGRVSGIRISTRPDALDGAMVHWLRDHGVTAIEIGAQSLDNRVLSDSGRGHLAEDVEDAAGRVRAAGIRLGLQLLPGLPGEDDESRSLTLSRVVELKPDDIRIYPLLVLRGTPLARLFEKGRYRPLTLEQAVRIAALWTVALTGLGARIIRLGLQATRELTQNLVAGPFHPAFGQMVQSEILLAKMVRVLASAPRGPLQEPLWVSPGNLSSALGQKRQNLDRLADIMGRPAPPVKMDPELAPGGIRWQARVFTDNTTPRDLEALWAAPLKKGPIKEDPKTTRIAKPWTP